MQVELYKEKLLTRQYEILNIMKNLKQEFQDINSCDIKEEADFASCSINSESNFYIYKQQQKELLEIEEALKKIDKGKYGICEMCEEEINPERLKIKPFAKYCIDCREIIEKENLKKG
jgi:DnaK suppressor protein